VKRSAAFVCLGASVVLGVAGFLAFAHLAPLVLLESAASSALRKAGSNLDREELKVPVSAGVVQHQVQGLLESPKQEAQEAQPCPSSMNLIHPYMQ
jgi:hypothetical protein